MSEQCKPVETLTDEELDVELQANNIDPHELSKKMLARIEKSIAEGHDTPRLHEAHAAFKRSVDESYRATAQLVVDRLKSWMAALYDQDRTTFDAVIDLKKKLKGE